MLKRLLSFHWAIELALASTLALWGQTQTPIALVIEQEFGEAKAVALPVERLAKEALTGAGLKVVPAGSAPETLVIRLHGTPHKGYDAQNIAHYFGATIDGEILAQGRGAGAKAAFHGEHRPPSAFVTPTMLTRPEDAPFASTFADSTFVTALGRLITTAWEGKLASVFLEVMKDPEELYQRAAIRALRDLKDPATVPPLLEKLKRSDRYKPGLQLDLVEALGAIGDPGSVDALITVVADTSLWDKTREASARALGKLGDRRGALPLAKALNRNLGWNFQQEIFKALEAFGDKRAIGPLATQLAERNKRLPAFDPTLEYVEKAYDEDLVKTLRKLSGQDFGPDGARWVAWWKQNERTLSQGP